MATQPDLGEVSCCYVMLSLNISSIISRYCPCLYCPCYTIPISVFITLYLVVVVEIWHVRCAEHMMIACVYVYHVDYDDYEECVSSVYSV